MNNEEYVQLIIPFPDIQKLYLLLTTCIETNIHYDVLINMLMTAFNNGADLNDMLNMIEDYTLPLLEYYPDTRKDVLDILVRFIGVVYQYIVLIDIITPIRAWGLEIDGIRIISGGYSEYTGVKQIAGYY